MAAYVFVDRWLLDAEPNRVYDVLSQPRSYPVWCGDVFPPLRPLSARNHRCAMRHGAVYLGDLLRAAETSSQQLLSASAAPPGTP